MLYPTRLPRYADPILIEALRAIYVRTLSGFTKPLPPPTPAEQLKWYTSLDHNAVRIWLWRDSERPWEAVAFTMLTEHPAYMSPVFGIDPAFQGRGWARHIIQHYIREAHGKPLHGEQLVSNIAIRKLNAEAGWRVCSEQDGIEYLRFPGRDERSYPDYDAILKGLDG